MLSINNRTALSSTRALKTLLLSAVLISVGANSALAKTSDTTIHFAKGAISSVVTGKLKPNEQERWYRFNAAAAQYAIINIAPLTGTSETANVGSYICQMVNMMAPKAGLFTKAAYPQLANIAYVSPAI